MVQATLSDRKSILRHFAALCAERIVTLLNDAGCGFQQDGRPFARLRPAAIAVRNRSSAARSRASAASRSSSSHVQSE